MIVIQKKAFSASLIVIVFSIFTLLLGIWRSFFNFLRSLKLEKNRSGNILFYYILFIHLYFSKFHPYDPKGLYCNNFSIKSTCVNNILLQQYLCNFNVSNASPSVYPAANKEMYASHLLPTTFPQVKHLMGIIIFGLFFSFFL